MYWLYMTKAVEQETTEENHVAKFAEEIPHFQKHKVCEHMLHK